MSEKMGPTKEARRQKILNAAAELFREKGYEATSVSEIVQRVGIAQGTFYLYFPSKEHIKLALHEQIIDQLIEDGIERFKNEPDLVKRLELGIKASFNVMKKNEKLILVAHLGTSAKECETADREMNKKLAVHLIKLLREGMVKGVFKEVNPEIIASLIIGMVEKTAISALMWEEPAKLEEIVPVVVDFIKKALVK